MGSAQEAGRFYLVVEGSNGELKGTIGSYNYRDVGHTTPVLAVDRTIKKKLAYQRKGINEGDKLNVFFAAAAAGDIIESEESECLISGTLIDKDTGAEEEIILDTEIMINATNGLLFNIAGAVDFTLTVANEKYSIGWAYTVPARKTLHLGRKDGSGKIYMYIGDDT